MATNRPRALRPGLAGLVAAAALAAGCSGGPALHPVEGTVYLDGSPVQTGERVTGYVVFHADPARGNKNLEDTKGDIGPDGRYVIFTRDKKGAPAGWYLVSVDLARTNPKDPYDYKAMVPDKYLDKARSGIEFEVVPSPARDRYDIKLEGIAPKK